MITTETEIWRTPINKGENYDNFKVSNLGRVLNLNYYNTGKAKLAKLNETEDGYLQVTLSKNGKSDTCKVHRLVAETFLPNPLNKPCVNHKIEGKKGKSMNFVFFNEDGTVDEKRSTIEWVTYEENNNYGTRNERISKANTNGKRSKKVLQFTLSGEFIREWKSLHECSRNGYDFRNVSACCRGKYNSAYGFRWEYA